jgi:hypothetical protein
MPNVSGKNRSNSLESKSARQQKALKPTPPLSAPPSNFNSSVKTKWHREKQNQQRMLSSRGGGGVTHTGKTLNLTYKLPKPDCSVPFHTTLRRTIVGRGRNSISARNQHSEHRTTDALPAEHGWWEGEGQKSNILGKHEWQTLRRVECPPSFFMLLN